MLARTVLRPLPLLVSGPRPITLSLSTTCHMQKLKNTQMPPRPTVAEAELEEHFLKGSGPGGQKINKTSSAVQLKHLPSGLVVKSQATRSRSQNRKIARTLLAEQLELIERGPQSRVALKAEVKRRRKASSSKKARRKYRALDQTQAEQANEGYGEDASTAEDVVHELAQNPDSTLSGPKG